MMDTSILVHHSHSVFFGNSALLASTLKGERGDPGPKGNITSTLRSSAMYNHIHSVTGFLVIFLIIKNYDLFQFRGLWTTWC